MSSKLTTAIDYFLPIKFEKEPENKRKARIVIFIFLFTCLSILAIWISSLNLENTNNFPFPIALGFTTLSAFAFKKTGSFHLSGHLLGLLVFFFLFPITIETGGLYSDDTLWLLLGPVLAFFAGNKWTGLIWSIILIAGVSYLYSLDISSPESLMKDSLIFDSNYYFTSIVFLFIMILGVIFIYENEKTKLVGELGSKRNELQKQNTLLETEVKKRTVSLEESNEQLKRSNADLEQFAYVASHDLQEPLRMVGNFVQLLEEEYSDKIDDEGKSYINFAVDGVSRMSLLIEELLQYSQLGKKGLEIIHFDLNTVVHQKTKDLSLLIKSKKAECVIQDLPRINGIPGQIGILFYNLINNALKFNTSDKPKIQISYRENSSHWIFSVADNGIGIANEYKEHIFELFKRLHRKEEYSGTGIGLSMCKKIINHHKGEIWFDSKENVGTTFHFSILKNLQEKN